MNGQAHESITDTALEALPAFARQVWVDVADTLVYASNYPDYFDGNCGDVERIEAIEPDYALYAFLPDGTTVHGSGRVFGGFDGNNYLEKTAPFDHYLQKAIDCLRREEKVSAAKYLGCLFHYVGDLCTPSHLAGPVAFKRLFPPPESMRFTRLDELLEMHVGQEDITGYKPEWLGVTKSAIQFRFIHKMRHVMNFSTAQVIPMLQCVYIGNSSGVEALAGKVQEATSRILADLLLSLAYFSSDLDEKRYPVPQQPKELNCTMLVPDDFFCALQYNRLVCPNSNISWRERKPVPLVLLLDEDGSLREETFQEGWGLFPEGGQPGLTQRTWIEFSLPEGLFSRFGAWVGVNHRIGHKGHLIFRAVGDEAVLLQTGSLKYDTPAVRLEVPLTGVRRLKLEFEDPLEPNASMFGDNHAVIAGPVLEFAR